MPSTDRNEQTIDDLVDDFVNKLPIKATEIGWEAVGELTQEFKQFITLKQKEARLEEFEHTYKGLIHLDPHAAHPSPDAEGPIQIHPDAAVHFYNQRKSELQSPDREEDKR